MIPDNKFIISSNYKYIYSRKIIYPELINNFDENYLNGFIVYQRKFLPNWLVPCYKDVLKQVPLTVLTSSPKKIYVSRRNKKVRKVINEKELIYVLEKLGFSTIYFEDYPIIEQIKIASESSQIIGIHGAGLQNINFCKKGTKILELFPPNYQVTFFYINSIISQFDYDFYIGSSRNNKWHQKPIMENFYVDIEVVQSFIEENWWYLIDL